MDTPREWLPSPHSGPGQCATDGRFTPPTLDPPRPDSVFLAAMITAGWYHTASGRFDCTSTSVVADALEFTPPSEAVGRARHVDDVGHLFAWLKAGGIDDVRALMPAPSGGALVTGVVQSSEAIGLPWLFWDAVALAAACHAVPVAWLSRGRA